MLSDVINFIYDAGLAFLFIFEVVKNVFLSLITPFKFVFEFLRSFFNYSFKTIETYETPEILSLEILNVFRSIPLWTELSIVLIAGLIVILSIATLKIILRV